MKKPVAILLAVAVLLALTGCGKESALTGTWKIDHVEADGATFTLSELEAMGEEELSHSVMVRYGLEQVRRRHHPERQGAHAHGRTAAARAAEEQGPCFQARVGQSGDHSGGADDARRADDRGFDRRATDR